MTTHDDTADSISHPAAGVTRRAALGAVATGAAMLAQTGLSAEAAGGEAPELAALDQMAAKPKTLAMAPRVTYLGGRPISSRSGGSGS